MSKHEALEGKARERKGREGREGKGKEEREGKRAQGRNEREEKGRKSSFPNILLPPNTALAILVEPIFRSSRLQYIRPSRREVTDRLRFPC